MVQNWLVHEQVDGIEKECFTPSRGIGIVLGEDGMGEVDDRACTDNPWPANLTGRRRLRM